MGSLKQKYYKITNVIVSNSYYLGTTYKVSVDFNTSIFLKSSDRIVYKGDQLFLRITSLHSANIAYVHKSNILEELLWNVLSKSNNRATIELVLKFLEDK